VWNYLTANGYAVGRFDPFCAAPQHPGSCAVPSFINLPPFIEDGDLHVVGETPRGSLAKFAYDPKLETFVLSKPLSLH
jgi:hypothetical protein